MEERNRLENQARRVASLHSEIMNIYHEIQDEADDIGRREAALKAKENQRVQRDLKAAKSGIESMVREFEDQLTSAGANQFNPLVRKSESAIASIIEAHKPRDNYIVSRTESDSYMPQFGEQVHVKRLGDKLATVVEALGDDETVLVQYGKIRARVKKTDVKAIPSLKKSSATSTTSPLNMQVLPQSQGPYSAERLKEGAAVDAGHDDGKGEGEVTKDVAPQEFVVDGEGQGVASPVVSEGGVALGEAPDSFVAPQRVEKIVLVKVEASVGGSSQVGVHIPEVAKASQGADEIKEKSPAKIKRVRAEGEEAGGDQAMKRAKAASKAASGTPEAMAVPGATNIVLGKATPEAMAGPNAAEVSYVSQVDAIPPLHDTSVAADEASKQMVIFRGCQVSAQVLAFMHRIEQAVPQVFAGLILKTSGFLAMIYETVARVIKVLDQFSPYTLPAQELYFLEAALTDLEVSGVAVGWLKSALDYSRQVHSTAVARAEVERLRQVSLEAAKAYEVAKLQLDEQIQGIFGEGIEMASSYSVVLKI